MPETTIFSNEVSLAVNFQNDAVGTVDLSDDHAVSSNVTCFFAALIAPDLRMFSIASSMSPFASVSAFLQSIMPAPVRSRSSFTGMR